MKAFVNIISLVLMMVPALAQSVKVKEDKNTPVNRYDAFSMAKGDVVLVMQRELSDSTLKEQIQSRIIEELKGRGYTFRDDATAPLRVSFLAEVLEKQEEGTIGPLGQQPADDPGQVSQSKTWSQVMNESSLSIIISEGATGKRLWESTSTAQTASASISEVLLGSASRSIRKVPKRK